ncbi:recombination protein NinG, partial [Escherichia coli]|uniref:recombination protein NinG n=1 Tax=Escherichia coli TaxID=562 RepID=UPI00384EACED
MAKPARRRCKNDECREWFHPEFHNQCWCPREWGTKLQPELTRKNSEKPNTKTEKKRQQRGR